MKVPIPKDIYPPRPGKPAYMQRIESWSKGKDGLPHYKRAAPRDRRTQPWKGTSWQ